MSLIEKLLIALGIIIIIYLESSKRFKDDISDIAIKEDKNMNKKFIKKNKIPLEVIKKTKKIIPEVSSIQIEASTKDNTVLPELSTKDNTVLPELSTKDNTVLPESKPLETTKETLPDIYTKETLPELIKNALPDIYAKETLPELIKNVLPEVSTKDKRTQKVKENKMNTPKVVKENKMNTPKVVKENKMIGSEIIENARRIIEIKELYTKTFDVPKIGLSDIEIIYLLQIAGIDIRVYSSYIEAARVANYMRQVVRQIILDRAGKVEVVEMKTIEMKTYYLLKIAGFDIKPYLSIQEANRVATYMENVVEHILKII